FDAHAHPQGHGLQGKDHHPRREVRKEGRGYPPAHRDRPRVADQEEAGQRGRESLGQVTGPRRRRPITPSGRGAGRSGLAAHAMLGSGTSSTWKPSSNALISLTQLSLERPVTRSLVLAAIAP